MTSPARTLLAATLLLSSMLLTPAAPAQTGAWTDGEFLVLASVAGQTSIVRVVPETGASAVLVVPQAIAGGISVLAFDPFRGGLLANASFAPDNPSLHRLWLIAHDGSHVALPGLTGALRALCSAGDGRIFFMHNTGLGPKVIEYLDASDQLRTLKAADGVTPFTIEVEHLLYHAPTNALIGSSTSYLSTTDCSSAGSSLYRIPLSADGLKVDGTVSCAPSSS
ncbi:MAG TPA: hypothetical protein VK824_07535, partial [Planctomycetota bacterium]|nr:hypothetical protein [Planctomycetota bacterium]